MKKATLITGDLDFRPLVESLVLHGTFVTIYSDPKEGSVDLLRAADRQVEITIRDAWNWSTENFKRDNPIPSGSGYQDMPDFYRKLSPIKMGKLKQGECGLYEINTESKYGFLWKRVDVHPGSAKYYIYDHKDRELLIKYLEMENERIEWE